MQVANMWCCCVALQVRAFDNDEVVHVDDSVDPVRDLDTIQVCWHTPSWGGGGWGGEGGHVDNSVDPVRDLDTFQVCWHTPLGGSNFAPGGGGCSVTY
jgi:hypothetical protein